MQLNACLPRPLVIHHQTLGRRCQSSVLRLIYSENPPLLAIATCSDLRPLGCDSTHATKLRHLNAHLPNLPSCPQNRHRVFRCQNSGMARRASPNISRSKGDLAMWDQTQKHAHLDLPFSTIQRPDAQHPYHPVLPQQQHFHAQRCLTEPDQS